MEIDFCLDATAVRTDLSIRPRRRQMAWTAEDRRRYAPAIQDMVRGGMIARLAQTIDAIDPQPKLGRQRVWSATIMLQALWHLARDGCAWRRLPSLFPPWTTVWSRLRRWRERAVLDRALAIMVACCRLAKGRKRRPTAAIVDTQSVRTGPQRGPRGYDAGKKMKGRKRVLMIDTQGHPLGVRAVPADVHEHRALLTLAPDLAAHSTLLLIWLDRGFAGDDPEAFLNGHGITADVVGIKRRKGFQLEPRRWKVEQTFGILQRYRRLRVDDEMSCETSRGMTVLASLFMTGMRLERSLRA
jgi:transposase